jgi:hypothetical protein
VEYRVDDMGDAVAGLGIDQIRREKPSVVDECPVVVRRRIGELPIQCSFSRIPHVTRSPPSGV